MVRKIEICGIIIDMMKSLETIVSLGVITNILEQRMGLLNDFEWKD